MAAQGLLLRLIYSFSSRLTAASLVFLCLDFLVPELPLYNLWTSPHMWSSLGNRAAIALLTRKNSLCLRLVKK